MARSHKSSTNRPPAADQSQCGGPADDAVDGVSDLLDALGLQLPSRRMPEGAYEPAMTTAQHTPMSASMTAPAPDRVGGPWLSDAGPELSPEPSREPGPEPDPTARRGLTSKDVTRVAAAATAAYAASTRHVYASCWRQWVRWCAGRDLTPLPGDPAAVCAYLTERAETGRSYGTIDQDCCAIAYHHRNRGLPDPVAHDAVRWVRRGLRRTLGTAPRRLAHPLSPAEIRQILTGIDRGTPRGARDAALILLGYAAALRISELAALTLNDLEHRPDGLLVTVARSKTDPDARGQVVAVACGQHPDTDPLAALGRWIRHRGSSPGSVFTRVQGSRVTLVPISGNRVARMLHERAEAAGLDAERITGHSLRAGHATTAALAGVGLARIAAQTRHRDLTVLLDRYIRPGQALQTTTSRDLGL
jgi:integrase